MTLREIHEGYRKILWQAGKDHCRQMTVRQLCKSDLFYLLRFGLNRVDADSQWVLDRCREVQSEPDGYLDLWFRESYKSTIGTTSIIQTLVNDPERTYGIFSFTRPIAKAFLRQIKTELETNESLKELFPDVLWRDPKKEAPKWSEDDGIIVRRKGNPKESSVEAWGLIDGQPTSKHFSDLDYDDIVTIDTVRTPGMLAKTTEAFLNSLNLGMTDGGRKRARGTRWHYADTYCEIIERKILTPRIWTATQDGTFTGKPWLWTPEQLAKKIADYGPYIAGAQLFLNPTQENLQGFDEGWLRYWKADRFTGLNIYILVDPASSKKTTSDYTVFIVIGLGSDHNYYVLHWVRDRLSLTQKANVLFSLHQKYKPVDIGYEQYGMQADIEHYRDRMERQNYRFSISPLGGKLAKEDRIKRMVPVFQQGRVYLPDASPYTQYDGETVDLTKQFVNDEYKAFPFCVHDDMLDTLARMMDPEFSAVFPQGEEIDPLRLRTSPEKDYNPLTWGMED